MFGSIGTAEFTLIMLIFLLPPILVLISRRTSGSKKFGWFFISLFLSWLGYGLFLVFTDKNEINRSV